MDAPDYLTVTETADRLRVTPTRVRQLIRAKQLAAEKWGTHYRIKAASVERYQAKPKGRHGFQPFMAALLAAAHKAVPLLQSDCQRELQQALDNVEAWLQKTRSRPYSVRPPVRKTKARK